MRKHSRRVTKKTLRLISNGRSVYECARLQPIGALFLHQLLHVLLDWSLSLASCLDVWQQCLCGHLSELLAHQVPKAVNLAEV